jgi:hypothetical protein
MPTLKKGVLLMSEETKVNLDEVKISYARQGYTKAGKPFLSGILQQRRSDGKFQASFKFVCFNESVSTLAAAADKVAVAEQQIENSGESVTPQDALPQIPQSILLSLEGYFQTKSYEANGRTDWSTSYIVENAQIVTRL